VESGEWTKGVVPASGLAIAPLQWRIWDEISWGAKLKNFSIKLCI
jgi:hypothetical protein